MSSPYVEMTITEFNNKYGYNSWGVPVYKIAEEKDIGTYVSLIALDNTIPYFCHFLQNKTLEGILKSRSRQFPDEVMEVVLLVEDKESH